jgi:glycosyltransferase involved in cell wall biosynthesis
MVSKVSKKLDIYDCFATASPIETEGIVILEAMASGLPILGVRKLAIPDIVKDGKNGYLSRPSDINGMAKNMIKIMESEKVLERLGKNSLEVAKAHEVRICKKRLMGFYKKIAKK